MHLLSVQNLLMSFESPRGQTQPVLRVPAFCLAPGEQVALRGPSGSGKTTFLHLLAGVLSPLSGEILIDGNRLDLLKEGQRDRLRAGLIGYVFQSFNLLTGFTCLENLILAMSLTGSPKIERARSMLDAVGLADRANFFPGQLSIGQQQRVAVARALVNEPKLVLADEPTGNLDPGNTDRVLSLLCALCREWGSSLLVVSHDQRVINGFDRKIEWRELNEVSFDEKGVE